MKYLILTLVILASVYGIMWELSKEKYQLEYGISFNQNYATSLGLDWKTVYTSMMTDLKPKYIRIAAMWSEVQKDKDSYDFVDVDWMMNLAGKNNTKVILVVGQKAPRWPECHVPDWVSDYSASDAEVYLAGYIEETVKRYRNHQALEIWQVENEPFISFKFGSCENYRKDLVEGEVELVKKIDPTHKIMLTDSGELSTWRKPIKLGDYFGTTLYRVVRTPKGRVISYAWLPPAFYRLKAQFWGLDQFNFFIAELQAEPWFTGAGAQNTPIVEQEKTMSPDRLKEHLDYVTHIGSPRAYLWGVEWWYFMKKEHGDSRYWEIIKDKIKETNFETVIEI